MDQDIFEHTAGCPEDTSLDLIFRNPAYVALPIEQRAVLDTLDVIADGLEQTSPDLVLGAEELSSILPCVQNEFTAVSFLRMIISMALQDQAGYCFDLSELRQIQAAIIVVLRTKERGQIWERLRITAPA